MTVEDSGSIIAPDAGKIDALVAKLGDRDYLRSANSSNQKCCAVCRAPIDPKYTYCRQCADIRKECREVSENFRPASRVGVLVYAVQKNGDRTAADLTDYRKGYGHGDAWWTITALLAQAFRDDLPVLEKEAGQVDIVTNVPLNSAENHDYLGNAVDRALSELGRKELQRRDLLESAAPMLNEAPGLEKSGKVRASATVPDDAHVLLVTDLWSTGRGTQSTADALFRAGAGQVSVLAVARSVSPSGTLGQKFVDSLGKIPAPSKKYPVLWADSVSAPVTAPATEASLSVSGTVSAAAKLPGSSIAELSNYSEENRAKGAAGEQRTAGVLSVFLNNAHARILYSVDLGTRDIDHVLFTTAGVFVINTKYSRTGLTHAGEKVPVWVSNVVDDARVIGGTASALFSDLDVDLDAVYHPMVVVWSEKAYPVQTQVQDGATVVCGDALADRIRSLPDVITPETCTAMFELVRLRLDRK